MLIDFNSMDLVPNPNFKGGIGHLDSSDFFDGHCKILHAVLLEGSTIGHHYHEYTCEVIFVIAGTATAIVDGVPEKLAPGTCTYCPKGSEHEIVDVCPEGLEFFSVVPEQ